MSRIHTEDDLLALLHSARTMAVAAAWARLGLFDALASGTPRRLDELDGDPRALAISAAILAHVGLLVGDADRWALSPIARQLHGSGALALGDVLDVLGDLSRLDVVIREGGPARALDGSSKGTRGGVRDDAPERSRSFLRMLYRRSEESAEQCAEWIAPKLAPGARILDLGGGHGRYARAFADRGFRVTLFDRPLAIELARELHGDAIELCAGDFHTDALGGPYDAVFLSNIVHGEPPEANAALFARLASAMAPGALLAVKDMLVDDLGDGPETAVMFGMTMLLYTEGGRSYGARELARWCAAAGLGAPELASFGTFALALARKARQASVVPGTRG